MRGATKLLRRLQLDRRRPQSETHDQVHSRMYSSTKLIGSLALMLAFQARLITPTLVWTVVGINGCFSGSRSAEVEELQLPYYHQQLLLRVR